MASAQEEKKSQDNEKKNKNFRVSDKINNFFPDFKTAEHFSNKKIPQAFKYFDF